MIESVTSMEFSHFSASTDVDHGTKAGIFHTGLFKTLSQACIEDVVHTSISFLKT